MESDSGKCCQGNVAQGNGAQGSGVGCENAAEKCSSKSVPTLSDAAEARLKEIVATYPKEKSAVMAALYIAQEELGSITQQAVAWVANRLSLAPAHVLEVATFYTMYYKKPVGRYHFQVCRTLSCALCGKKEITQYLYERFKIAPGEVSADGMWSFEEVECLGSCGTAPVVQINDVFFENLNPERLKVVIDQIASDKPDLRLSMVRDELGNGLPAQPRSQVYPTS